MAVSTTSNLEMRYQYWGPNGITWTNWFKCPNNDIIKEKYQYKCSRYVLKNEYRYN